MAPSLEESLHNATMSRTDVLVSSSPLNTAAYNLDIDTSSRKTPLRFDSRENLYSYLAWSRQNASSDRASERERRRNRREKWRIVFVRGRSSRGREGEGRGESARRSKRNYREIANRLASSFNPIRQVTRSIGREDIILRRCRRKDNEMFHACKRLILRVGRHPRRFLNVSK